MNKTTHTPSSIFKLSGAENFRNSAGPKTLYWLNEHPYLTGFLFFNLFSAMVIACLMGFAALPLGFALGQIFFTAPTAILVFNIICTAISVPLFATFLNGLTIALSKGIELVEKQIFKRAPNDPLPDTDSLPELIQAGDVDQIVLKTPPSSPIDLNISADTTNVDDELLNPTLIFSDTENPKTMPTAVNDDLSEPARTMKVASSDEQPLATPIVDAPSLSSDHTPVTINAGQIATTYQAIEQALKAQPYSTFKDSPSEVAQTANTTPPTSIATSSDRASASSHEIIAASLPKSPTTDESTLNQVFSTAFETSAWVLNTAFNLFGMRDEAPPVIKASDDDAINSNKQQHTI